MSIDLKIYPLDYHQGDTGWSANYYLSDHLIFKRDYDIFEQIEGWENFGRSPEKICLQTEGLPTGVSVEISTFQEAWEAVSKWEDPYGHRLRWCYASGFSSLRVPEDILPYNAAILAFLKALPDKIRILLYWF